jgi:energy-converting hydrogenase A subunit M
MNLLVLCDDHQVTSIAELDLSGVFELIKCVELAQRRLVGGRLVHYVVKLCVIKQAYS